MAAIPQQEIADLLAAWVHNPQDLGVGVYNPTTGAIHLGSMDTIAGGAGHYGLVKALGLTAQEWMGFVVSSTKQFQPFSGFLNPPWSGGSIFMPPAAAAMVRQALQDVGLL
jgi:hypothetical protein